MNKDNPIPHFSSVRMRTHSSVQNKSLSFGVNRKWRRICPEVKKKMAPQRSE